jgi:hypothetical protein
MENKMTINMRKLIMITEGKADTKSTAGNMITEGKSTSRNNRMRNLCEKVAHERATNKQIRNLCEKVAHERRSLSEQHRRPRRNRRLTGAY